MGLTARRSMAEGSLSDEGIRVTDHLEVRVRDVASMLERLAGQGIAPIIRRLRGNPVRTEKVRAKPQTAQLPDRDVWVGGPGHRIANVPDRDGNLVCLYDHPEE